jgi:hypothetical protein
MLKDEVSYRLASAFINEYRKHNSYLFTLKNVDKTKWWVHFEKASGYRSIKGWTPETHVKCCFEKYGKILPFRLYGKTAIEAWEEYHHRYDGKQSNDIITQMLDTYKKMKKWGGEYTADFYKNNKLMLKRKNLSIHFLSLSKEFRKINDEEHYYDKETLNIKRTIVFRNKKLYKKMKELFGSDFY